MASNQERLSAAEAMTNGLAVIIRRIGAEARQIPRWRPAPIRRAVIIARADQGEEFYDLWQEKFGPA